jgi:hypothetical protein
MSSVIDWLSRKSFEPRRYRPGQIGNWSGHLPFAHDLLLGSRPSLLVELGTHLGESYFGFCQTIAENHLDCTAYAVDSWEGEPHAGFYDHTVYEEVDAYNKANYASFSYLLKMFFDDALKNFSDESVDLLHIDGLHTFEAVSHDFHSWLPKVKPGGIVLLHDVEARHQDFGVWKLWEQLQLQGETFEFKHSWGLGVFRKPGGGEITDEFLRTLFHADERAAEAIRRYYSFLALELEAKHRDTPQKRETSEAVDFQVYLPDANGYSEARSRTTRVASDVWTRLTIDLESGVAAEPLRLDPADRPALIELRGVSLASAFDRRTLWSLGGTELDALSTGGTLLPLGGAGENGAKLFFSYGLDPQLFLPPLDPGQFDQPLTLEIWVRIRTDLTGLISRLQEQPPADEWDPADFEMPTELNPEAEDFLAHVLAQREQFKIEAGKLREELAVAAQQTEAAKETERSLLDQIAFVTSQREDLKTQLAASIPTIEAAREEVNAARQKLVEQQAALEAEKEQLTQELNRRQTRIYYLQDLHDLTRQAQEQLEEVQARHEQSVALNADLQTRVQAAEEERDRLQSTLNGILHSRSWQITSPIRKFSEKLQSR